MWRITQSIKWAFIVYHAKTSLSSYSVFSSTESDFPEVYMVDKKSRWSVGFKTTCNLAITSRLARRDYANDAIFRWVSDCWNLYNLCGFLKDFFSARTMTFSVLLPQKTAVHSQRWHQCTNLHVTSKYILKFFFHKNGKTTPTAVQFKLRSSCTVVSVVLQ